MLNQKEGVTNAVKSLFPDYKLGGEIVLSSILTADKKKELRSILFAGFRAGEIEMQEKSKAKYAEDTAMNKYVSGLLDNWIRKNPDFNAGAKYVTKNPGSRKGSGDEQIREMRKLKKTTNDVGVLATIDEAIEARLAEIKPESVFIVNG